MKDWNNSLIYCVSRTEPKTTAEAHRYHTVFDNPAGVYASKPKFMNTLQPPPLFYKTFWTSSPEVRT